jgi:alkanesulfonate monooxygenase SsuD/methylene tetrahydromethanopterin reductase-like flavin-dependent oxidoreductase (luciferase family)
VKIGVSLPVFTADPARPLDLAARAAALGLDGVFSPDHLLPPALSPASGADRPSLEAFTVLAAVAARHPSLHVGTLVARVTLRSPGLLAKQASMLDEMTGGRGILGLGAGDRASIPEHERFGFPFPPVRRRLQLLEETVVALRALFAGDAWRGGAAVPAMDGPILPGGSPEIWVGGLSEDVLAVAARVADAWNGWGLDAKGFDLKVRRLRELSDGRGVRATWGGIALVGEDREDLQRLIARRQQRGLSTEGVWTGTAAELRSFVDGLGDIGADWFIALPAGPADRIDVVAGALKG